MESDARAKEVHLEAVKYDSYERRTMSTYGEPKNLEVHLGAVSFHYFHNGAQTERPSNP